MLVHEKGGALVGEDHGGAREVCAMFGYDVLCDDFQESLIHVGWLSKC